MTFMVVAVGLIVLAIDISAPKIEIALGVLVPLVSAVAAWILRVEARLSVQDRVLSLIKDDVSDVTERFNRLMDGAHP